MTNHRNLRERTRVLRNRPGAPSPADARLRTEKLIRDLERALTAGTKASRTLVRRLKACCPEDPCKSAVCQACALDHQAHAIAKLEQTWPEGTDLVTAAIIIRKLERPQGELNTLQLASIERAFRRKLKDAGCDLIPIWAYIDVSFNTHAQNDYGQHWLPHLHFVPEAKYQNNLAELGKCLPRSTSIKRPVQIKAVRDWIDQVSYVCKPVPQQRRDFHREKRSARPGKYPLTTGQSVEFALWLSERRPRDRHFTCGRR